MKNPIDQYLGTENMNLQERISACAGVYFQPGDPKHSTKNEMDEIKTDIRREPKHVNVSKYGADGLAMLLDIY
jgi:hypothetical protein